MTSHFSTGTTIRRSPAWCKKGMYGDVPPDVGDRPSSLNTMAEYRYIATGYNVDLILLIWTPRNQADTGWANPASGTGFNMRLIILDQVPAGRYRITLQLRDGVDVLDSYAWLHDQPYNQPRWDTGRLSHLEIPTFREQHVHVMG